MRCFPQFLICCVAISLFAGCRRSADVPPVGSGGKQWVHQDFESLWGWMSADKAASITPEKAHSGKYSLTVGPGIEYSAQSTIMWEGLRLSNKINTYGQWTELNESIVLNPNVAYENSFSVYLWSQNTPAPVYLDDLVITEAE